MAEETQEAVVLEAPERLGRVTVVVPEGRIIKVEEAEGPAEWVVTLARLAALVGLELVPTPLG